MHCTVYAGLSVIFRILIGKRMNLSASKIQLIYVVLFLRCAWFWICSLTFFEGCIYTRTLEYMNTHPFQEQVCLRELNELSVRPCILTSKPNTFRVPTDSHTQSCCICEGTHMVIASAIVVIMRPLYYCNLSLAGINCNWVTESAECVVCSCREIVFNREFRWVEDDRV